MSQTIEEQLASLRERVTDLEHDDADFARRSNLLLDDIIITNDNLKILTDKVDSLTEKVDGLTGKVDTLTQRMDTMTQRVEMLAVRVDQIGANLSSTQTIVTQLAGMMMQSIQTAEADRAIARENQVEIRRIWEYLLNERPNGRGQS